MNKYTLTIKNYKFQCTDFSHKYIVHAVAICLPIMFLLINHFEKSYIIINTDYEKAIFGNLRLKLPRSNIRNDARCTVYVSFLSMASIFVNFGL